MCNMLCQIGKRLLINEPIVRTIIGYLLSISSSKFCFPCNFRKFIQGWNITHILKSSFHAYISRNGTMYCLSYLDLETLHKERIFNIFKCRFLLELGIHIHFKHKGLNMIFSIIKNDNMWIKSRNVKRYSTGTQLPI